jgi:hypothetical protein
MRLTTLNDKLDTYRLFCESITMATGCETVAYVAVEYASSAKPQVTSEQDGSDGELNA